MNYPIAKIVKNNCLDEIIIEYKKLCNVFEDTNGKIFINGNTSLLAQTYGEFKGMAIILNNSFDYKIVKDSIGNIILVPIRR